MASRNDVTGDKIQTKGVLSKEGENNWDRIFGKKEPIKLTQHEVNSIETIEALIEIHDAKRRSRIDTIGSNGNDGLHYDKEWDKMNPVGKEILPEYELDKSTGEVVKVDAKRLTDAHNGH